MTLSDVKPGEKVIIQYIPDQQIRMQIIRLGLQEGSIITCVEKLWRGPLVVSRGRQELAMGRALAETIQVQKINNPSLRDVS